MSDNINDKGRSKLTLKLSDSTKSKTTLTLTKKTQHTSQNTTNAIYNKKGIQVTIKGRKKEDNISQNIETENLKARYNSIEKYSSRSLEYKNYNLNDHITDNKNETQKEITKSTQDKVKATINETNKIQNPTISQNIDNNVFDNFDIRSKIKESIEISQKETEIRNKEFEEKKIKIQQEEQEKRERENNIKFSKKNKKEKYSTNSEFDSEKPNLSKKELINKSQKLNNRKLTYIIDKDYDDEDSRFRKKKKVRNALKSEESSYKKITRDVSLPELITVSDLADRMSEKTGDVVKKLFTMGMVVTSNQAIDADTAEIIISEFGHNVNRVSDSDVENVLEEDVSNFTARPRAPIVTIMGHVDHGKTSLLDALRQTDIVANEFGGITQHIGASRIKSKNGNYITFLDTPGHQAFTEMRSRGANITDIVILVVAADDGIKEQTIEAINHAKAANVPIIVAINKIDKPGADPSKVINELLNYDIISEEMGGDIMFVNVSAKQKQNLDKLEDAILLQAELLELKAVYDGKSSGVVLESKVDPQKGVVATLLVEKGSLDISDLIIVGTSFGKIRKMTDSQNKNVNIATPSIPVEVLGLDEAPKAGDKFIEVDSEKQAREIISYRSRKEKEKENLKNSAKSISDIFKESKNEVKSLNIIIKADVHGSLEAINASLIKLNNEEISIKIIHMATGGISDSDVSLAAASNALIVGFNTRANISTKDLALQKNIEIRYFSIIYDLIDDIKALLSGMLSPIKSEKYLGQAEIREVFKISGSGKIAGCIVNEGIIKRNARARLLRENIVIHNGSLKTIKRFKEDVKEVKNGFECGLSFDNYEDIKQQDIIECYEIVEQKRSID